MDFKTYLKTNAQKVETELDKALSEFLEDAKKTSPKLVPFAKAFINSCKGGKRIRGVLCKLGYDLAISKTPGVDKETPGVSISEMIKVGAAYEILHAALLIHDDIIDQSPTRRGQPSVYQALGGNHYGISQAISIGDIGLYLPIKIISETDFLPERKLKALNYFSQILINTGWGQVMDVELSQPGYTSEVSRDDVKLLYTLKTAKYTIAGPLQIGAILAGADENLIRVFGEFGESLGIAFQIKDDILDKESTSLGLVQAVKYASTAKKLIPKITQDKAIRQLLEGMTNYLVERSR